jgi:hypothetical protein
MCVEVGGRMRVALRGGSGREEALPEVAPCHAVRNRWSQVGRMGGSALMFRVDSPSHLQDAQHLLGGTAGRRNASSTDQARGPMRDPAAPTPVTVRMCPRARVLSHGRAASTNDRFVAADPLTPASAASTARPPRASSSAFTTNPRRSDAQPQAQ